MGDNTRVALASLKGDKHDLEMDKLFRWYPFLIETPDEAGADKHPLTSAQLDAQLSTVQPILNTEGAKNTRGIMEMLYHFLKEGNFHRYTDTANMANVT